MLLLLLLLFKQNLKILYMWYSIKNNEASMRLCTFGVRPEVFIKYATLNSKNLLQKRFFLKLKIGT